MDKAKKGDWVEIHTVVLKPGQRAPKLPAETLQVPLEMWVERRTFRREASPGDDVTVRTMTGRVVKGRLDGHSSCLQAFLWIIHACTSGYRYGASGFSGKRRAA